MPEHRPAVIVDIDGTLANIDGRLHHISGQPKDWTAFHAGIPNDAPIPEVVRVVTALADDNAILLCTGRDEETRAATRRWLWEHGVPYSALFMRPRGDRRPDYVVKRELYEDMIRRRFDPWLVIDDRDSVVAMWRSLGLVCFQCADGNF